MPEVLNCEPAKLSNLRIRLVSHIRFGTSLLQAKPFDISSGEGRSRERYRRVFLTVVSSGAARLTSLVTILVSVPLVIHHLGTERYALWATITSTLALLIFADFGIGNGLLNAISESHGTEDRTSAIAYVSTSFFVLLLIALIAAVLFFTFYPFIPWNRIFNITSPVTVREAGPTAAVFLVCFLAQLPLGVVQRVQFGYQDGFITHLWSAAGNLLGFIGLFCVLHYRAGLPYLVLAVAGAPVLTGSLNTVILFSFQKPWLMPRLDRISDTAARRILKLGFLFFIIQVAGTVGYQTDNLIVSQIMGAREVAQYAVPFRLFAIAPAIVAMVVMPLWPAYGEASARGDIEWIKKTLIRSMSIGVLVLIGANFLLVLVARPLIKLWVGSEIAPSLPFLIGLAVWAVVASGISAPLAMFCNGTGIIKMQAICGVAMAAVNVTLSIFLTRRIGVAGPVYGSIASQVLCVFIPFFYYLPRMLNAIQKRIPPLAEC